MKNRPIRHLFDFWYIRAQLARINYWYVVGAFAVAILGWNAFEDWRIAQMDYEGAVEAYHQEDYDVAFQVFQRLAEDGDAASQLALGIMYGDGDGVERSRSTAAGWLQKAAEQGEVAAMTGLADILYDRFHSPNGAPQEDLVSAADWYRQAAEAGNRYGQRRYGLALIKGEGVDVDRDAGLAWIMRAIEAGNDYTMVSLGRVYEDGLLGEADHTLALQWYLRAARRGVYDGMKLAVFLLEDEQSPVFDLEQAYVWALVGRHWWPFDRIWGDYFGNSITGILREVPYVGIPPFYAAVHMGLMSEREYGEKSRAYEEARGDPETWPYRLGEEPRRRAEAAADAIIARWPEPPIEDDAPL